MKKICFILSAAFLVSTAHAAPKEDLPLLPSEQEPYQQLIGYAEEVKNALIEQKKEVGKYVCNDIFSVEDYTAITKYTCEAIVHTDEGPFVVRYRNIDSETGDLIAHALSCDSQKKDVYYNNGRFRFSLKKKEEKASAE